ncbi:MAG: type II restriction endonuclease subunit M, partial [Candidatus Competibacteraceae bacterium]|nr:type II restriction endonuclease subunit M [Candidatus Competibacteraceae bacterium]
KLGDWNPDALKAELQQIQAEIDAIAFDLYGFSPKDREAVARLNNVAPEAENPEEDEELVR